MFSCVFAVLAVIFHANGVATHRQPNVLLIMLDDFRGGIKALDDELAVTPNMDALLAKSFFFSSVYAQQALCAPSRNSMLTSRRPDSIMTYNFQHYWRAFAGNYTTLPQYFKQHGYRTESIGKIFHHGPSSNKTDDFPYSWTNPTFIPSTQDFRNHPVCSSPGDSELHRNLLCPVIVERQPEQTLPDIQSAKAAREFLMQASQEAPFFLGVGFYKPHIPFKFPREYLAHHRLDNFRGDFLRPFDLPSVAWNPYNDLRDRDDVRSLNVSYPFGPMPSEFSARIRQHYYASVTYVDDLLGGILELVDFSNTVVVLTSDHGWSLGEHAEWSKYSNYEVALRVPLIIYDPARPQTRMKRVEAMGELIDLFPTLVDVAGLPRVSRCNNSLEDDLTCTEGKSLHRRMTLDNDADADEADVVGDNEVAFSQYPRPGSYPTKSPDSDQPKLREIKIMGYSLRTRRFRYTAWIKFNNKKFKRNWNKMYGEELYDHSIDASENMNLAHRPEMRHIKSQLRERLMKKFP